MSKPKTKKAAPKKAASKKAPPSASSKDAPATAPAPEKKKAAEKAAADRVDGARLRRMARAGVKAPARCALLGIALDVGPRSNRWQRPRQLLGEVVSELGLAIVESDVSPKELEQAAAALRKVGGSS